MLTAVFDNVMIAVGLVTYPAEHLSGLRIGLAPLEDFAYALAPRSSSRAVVSLLPTERSVGSAHDHAGADARRASSAAAVRRRLARSAG